MRDLIAGVIALVLLLVAASLATTLRLYRRRRQRARDTLSVLGRTVIAEIPAGDDLILFAEDETCFYYGDRPINKKGIVAARVLINGSPITASISQEVAHVPIQPASFEDRPEGIARDRWDVAIETIGTPTGPTSTFTDVIMVECGAIRERVSQELARAVFEALRRTIEYRDQRI